MENNYHQWESGRPYQWYTTGTTITANKSIISIYQLGKTLLNSVAYHITQKLEPESLLISSHATTEFVSCNTTHSWNRKRDIIAIIARAILNQFSLRKVFILVTSGIFDGIEALTFVFNRVISRTLVIYRKHVMANAHIHDLFVERTLCVATKHPSHNEDYYVEYSNRGFNRFVVSHTQNMAYNKAFLPTHRASRLYVPVHYHLANICQYAPI